MPDIENIADSQEVWMKPEDVIPSIIAEVGKLSPTEIERVVDALKKAQYLYPTTTTIASEDAYDLTSKDYFVLNEYELKKLINFLTEAKNANKEVIVGSVQTVDDYNDPYLKLVVTTKENLNEQVKEKFVSRIKHDLLSQRTYLQQRIMKDEKNKIIDEKMADLIAKFQSKQIAFDDFKKESDLLDKKRKAVYS